MAEKNRFAAAQAALVKPQGPMKLYVGSLHYNITEPMLRAIFEPFGIVESVQLQYDPESNRSKGFGFVNFRDSGAAKRAMDQMNGFELAGRPMKVNTVSERTDGSMSFLDDEETEKGGIEMNAQSRASLMQKLAQTHGSGWCAIIPHTFSQNSSSKFCLGLSPKLFFSTYNVRFSLKVLLRKDSRSQILFYFRHLVCQYRIVRTM